MVLAASVAAVFRIMSDRKDIEIVAINDITPIESQAYLLKYDTVMGTFDKKVTWTTQAMYVDNTKILMTSIKDPRRPAVEELNVDVVLESTGVFRQRAQLEKHLQAAAAGCFDRATQGRGRRDGGDRGQR